MPPELLAAMIMGQDSPATSLRLYILLLGLSHGTRQALRGTLRHMSFVDDSPSDFDLLPTPTADSLAALVGPCKDLETLALPNYEPGLWGCGRAACEYGPWVDEAFSGHIHLAQLRVPWGHPLMHVLPRILGHLPGLVDFDMFGGDPYDPTGLLATLVRCCPRLAGLHLSVCGENWEAFDPTPLLPLSGQLRRLSITEVPSSPRLEAFLGSLTSLEQLSLNKLTPALAARLGPRLAQLTLRHGPSASGFTRLESLEVLADADDQRPVLVPLLGASRASIRTLSMWPREPAGPLFGALDTCSALNDLTLRLEYIPGTVDLANLPPSLLNRLHSLRLRVAEAPSCSHPIRIASSSLRELHLSGLSLGPGASLTLACPALVSLTLPTAVRSVPSWPLAMGCPALRQITGLGSQDLAGCQAMPLLKRVHCFAIGKITPQADEALAALLAGSPRLTRLTGLRCTDPGQLTALCRAAPCLSHIQATLDCRLGAPPPDGVVVVTLCLPAHVTTLDLGVALARKDGAQTPADTGMRIEAPGLRLCALGFMDGGPHAPRGGLALGCPVLEGLLLRATSALTAFTLDTTPSGTLRSLQLKENCPALAPASLLACLQAHAACLTKVVLRDVHMPSRDAWPPLAAALCGMPRLAHLELGCHPTPHLALACPALRCLKLPPMAGVTIWQAREPVTIVLRSLVLACPLLEELRAPVGPNLERLELGEVPYLCRVGEITGEWPERLAGRWPGAMLIGEVGFG
ncbi:hypothetical protein PAPYR_10234 [Paratrimastix pyriformis]|uniref:Uncharacterized protein n=1 Tax=Paratrimastix pyriformis TaxID=342808 RepID=A0ABQ8UC36_9EUKA|nr:hypothetical protein PAPYR_10234 [Paratrimastix pyriformis]